MKRNKNEPQRRDTWVGAIQYRAAEEGQEESRQVTLSLSSEEPVERCFGTEILCHDADAVDLSRLEEMGVVLFNHNPNVPIGRVVSVELDEQEHKVRAVVEFDTDDESERIFQKVKNGTLKGVSVGYAVDVWEDVEGGAVSENGRFEGPCSVAMRWTPYELSIVSVPADMTVGVGRSMDVVIREKEKEDMKDNEKKPVDTAGGLDEAKVAARAVEAERKRVAEINDMCRQFGMDANAYIENGMSVEEARKGILGELAKERQAIDTAVSVVVDEGDKMRAAATDGLALRAGIKVEHPAEGAREFQGKTLLRLASEIVERETGKNVRGMTDEMIFRAALTGSGAFPEILSNVANKSIAQAYQEAPTTYQLWTASGSNADFKEATRYRLSEAGTLEKINENGEFKHDTVGESSVKTSVATYGKTFSITRQALINDDLGILSRIPAIHGAAVRRMVNTMVYKKLTDNPTIEGAPLFDKAHNNLQDGATLDVAGLGKLKAAMARQTNLLGQEKLNIQPAFLIVPPELEVQAAQLIHSTVDPSKNNATVNPFANKLSVISDPELTNTKEFYLAAASGYAPTIEVTTLNGNTTPTLESAVQFDTLGIKWRIYFDVGVNLIDYRGIQKATMK